MSLTKKPIEPLESFLTEMTSAYCNDSQKGIMNVLAQRILLWGQLKTKMRVEGCMLSEQDLIQNHINNLLDALYKFQELRGGK